jgi:predicted dehydrogenase
MSQSPIKWGILGTSYISEIMASAIHESCTSQLVAIGSRSLSTARAFSNKFSIPKFYDDYQCLLNDPEIDVIYIGLPNHLHKEWILRSALSGKHILCEKPFVVSITDAQEVISFIKTSKVFCMEALMYRCHPFTKKLQELIQSKILGDIKLYNATYTANISEIANPVAGGSIRNLGCYPISLVRLLTNAEPTEICSMGRLSQKNHTDNQASVILKFEDNSMAVVSTADDIEMFWQFDIYGTSGSLKVITNPWKPDHQNKLLIFRNGESEPQELNITAEKSLYTYQIDIVSENIKYKKNKVENTGISLLDSLGNTIVIEKWLEQVKGPVIIPA